MTSLVPTHKALERFLLDRQSLGLDLLRDQGFAAYAYRYTETDEALKATLRPDYLRARALHLATKAKLLPLLERWQEAGVELLVFKGFYLAEWVYEDSALRLYNDTDLLILPEQADLAAQLAEGLGWSLAWNDLKPSNIFGYRKSNGNAHEMMHLRHKDAPISLDIHRRILHNHLPYTRLQQRFTDAAWQASQHLLADGTALRVLAPVDALLMGLILNRAWSDDAWQLRARDFLDFRALIARFSLGLDRLLARARELDCERTVALFLERCNAFENRLDLRPPSLLERQWWNLLISPERGNPALEHALARFARLPGLSRHTLRELPGVHESLKASRAQADIEGAAKALERNIEAPYYPNYDEWDAIKQGVKRALLLLKLGQGHESLERLALYNALQRRRCPVQLEHVQGKLELTLEGRVLELD